MLLSCLSCSRITLPHRTASICWSAPQQSVLLFNNSLALLLSCPRPTFHLAQWAGLEAEALYPHFMNPAAGWPTDVEAACPILQEHDRQLLKMSLHQSPPGAVRVQPWAADPGMSLGTALQSMSLGGSMQSQSVCR